MSLIATAEASPYLAPAFGLAGVVVGGVIAGAVAVFLDARRRKDEREARIAQREHDARMRRRDRMFDLYTRLFAAWSVALDSITRFTRDRSNWKAAYLESDHFKEQQHKDSLTIFQLRNNVAELAPQFDALAPPRVLEAFTQLSDALQALDAAVGDVVIFGDEHDPMWADSAIEAYDRFKAAARDDLGHYDVSDATDPSA